MKLKKLTLAIAAGLALPFLCNAQITFDQNLIQMNAQVPGSTVSTQVELTNEYTQDLTIDSITLWKHFGTSAFTISPASTTIGGNSSITVDIDFSPVHNVTHYSQLMVYTQDRGTFSIPVEADAEASMNVYTGTDNRSGQNLKNVLESIVTNNHTNQLGYSPARDAMFMTSDNQKVNGNEPVNTLECVYTGTQVTNYNDRQDAQNQGFNTEHTFPQSLFNSNFPMKGDIHHLFPTTQQSNSARANYPFGYVNNPSWSNGGSKGNNSTFEPRDSQKGRSARAMMYFVLRYGDYSSFYQGQESLLLDWHRTYDPTQFDRNRNDAVENAQGNRNPFVDYPQFMDRMKSLVGNADFDEVNNLVVSNDTIDNGGRSSNTNYAVSVRNDGNRDVEITGLSVTDTMFVNYRNVSGFPITLKPGEGVEIDVVFKFATVLGTSQIDVDEDLTIETNNGDESVKLLASWESNSVDELAKNKASIYPNPVKNTLWFTDQVESARLYDATGKLLLEEQNTKSLDLSNLPKGLFFVKFSFNGVEQVEKIVH
ncbi:endonuclease [Salibacter sp.]|uniref:endonuclease n=1 Tax=Salibacter sp. TaxID=2010995 RepID=UPI0028702B94|nr:endonuclease [Salibacter sp.]MDR9488575.1 endonuclease [Salibacter sp.]